MGRAVSRAHPNIMAPSFTLTNATKNKSRSLAVFTVKSKSAGLSDRHLLHASPSRSIDLMVHVHKTYHNTGANVTACRLDRLLARKAPARDPDLIRFTRHLIDPPSHHEKRKLPWGSRSTPQAEFVFNMLKKQVTAMA